MVPMCVTEAVSPLGNWTIALIIVVMEDNKLNEHIIWSVTPISISQVFGLKALLFTTLAEKTEWERLISNIALAKEDTPFVKDNSFPCTVETSGEEGAIKARSCWHCSVVNTELLVFVFAINSYGWGTVTWWAIAFLFLNLKPGGKPCNL